MIYEREVYFTEKEKQNQINFPDYLIIRLKKEAEQG